jgi:hypothetical protein
MYSFHGTEEGTKSREVFRSLSDILRVALMAGFEAVIRK